MESVLHLALMAAGGTFESPGDCRWNDCNLSIKFYFRGKISNSNNN